MSKKKDAPSPIEAYLHTKEERLNNPPVGMVDPDTDPDGAQKTYSYDPHIDPQLQWAGKAEHLSFEVPTVSLHVHERIDPLTIIEAVRKRETDNDDQMEISLFSQPEENPPIREAIQFYKHKHNWSNRLIAGDSLLVMNSLLEKEGMGGKVQMIYIDPPYGIKYGSNFQPFVNKRNVNDGKDEDLTSEPEQIRAFRDTWELGLHSFLTYLRDRLSLSVELLTQSGSIFVQIGDQNLHHVREIMDEVLGSENFVSQISFKTSPGDTTRHLPPCLDYLLWYAKDKDVMKFNKLYLIKEIGVAQGSSFDWLENSECFVRPMSKNEKKNPAMINESDRPFRWADPRRKGTTESAKFTYSYNGKDISPGSGMTWKTTPDGIQRLHKANRLGIKGTQLNYKRYLDDFPGTELLNVWTDTMNSFMSRDYVVQTDTKIIQRCVIMASDPGDLILDITCGSGTTAYVCEQWGRRWITCDTSRVAVTLSKIRLMCSTFPMYTLARPSEGVDSGFQYESIPHVSLRTIVNNENIDSIYADYCGQVHDHLSKLNHLSGESYELMDLPLEASPNWNKEMIDVYSFCRSVKLRMISDIEQSIIQNSELVPLYDYPLFDRTKSRITGPFTVEAVPAPAVKSIDEIVNCSEPVADDSIARSGETLRQSEWRDELLKTGVRGKNKQYIQFSRIEVLPGYRWIHAVAETIPDSDQAIAERVAVSFASEFMPLEQRQVALALEEAQSLVPKPKILIFAAFQFDPEASKDIDETNWPGVQLLRVQMNADLLTEDLKKKRASNDSFWLIGQPEVIVEKGKDGKYLVKVLGFDYYNTRSGQIESGGKDKIAMWMLDTDYDGRSLFPRQVFLPLAGDKEGWSKLAKDLKTSIDESLIDQYRGTESLPFTCGDHKRIAVKIVDDRGIESLVIKGLD